MIIKVRFYSLFSFLLSVFLTLSLNAYAQSDSLATYQTGHMLFSTNCSPCHSVHKEMMGPMLASINKKRKEEWLLSFIGNSQKMIVSGDQDARFLFEQYNHTVMPSFPALSEKEKKAILFYVRQETLQTTEEVHSFRDKTNTNSEKNVVRGKKLFQRLCSTCHFIGKEGYGPSLGSVPKTRPTTWLLAFVRNSQKLVKEKDEYAQYLFNRYDKKEMPTFEYLKDKQISSILEYIEFESESPQAIAGANGRKVNSAVYLPTSSASVGAFGEGKKHYKGGYMKVFFIVLATLGMVLLGIILTKFFKYLAHKN